FQHYPCQFLDAHRRLRKYRIDNLFSVTIIDHGVITNFREEELHCDKVEVCAINSTGSILLRALLSH
ncbi:MAG: hypothetical protein ACJ703_07565, partial [Nitrososphaera sp.]